ncbi:MAG: hypothetical protein NNA18_07250 [Nitrospira sp.]|nr:hypothetical protein [Nitrospira sp.]
MNVLGLTSASGGFHDSSAVWVRNGKIEAAVSEERFTRIKHDYSFPQRSLEYLLKVSGIQPHEFDGVAVAWRPYNPFSGFFQRNILDVPRTLLWNLATMPGPMLGYVVNNFIGKKIIGRMAKLSDFGFSPSQIHYLSHHLSHAASAYRTSGYEDALSVNLDCFGPDDHGRLWSGATFVCEENEIRLLEYIPPFASLGLFYSAVSVGLGFKFGDGEGKTMGLAAYGDPTIAYQDVKPIAPDFCEGRWTGPQAWTDFRLIDKPKLLYNTRWGRYLRRIINEKGREHVAAGAQRILEEVLSRYFDYLLARTGKRSVVLAGGIFLNIKFNQRLAEREDVDKVYIHPFPSDGGTAAGAALELAARLSANKVGYELPSAALGPSYGSAEISHAIAQYEGRVIARRQPDATKSAARFIADGKIVGWFQGRSEWGPRALGFRSVLGDPRDVRSKERLNKLLKSRDWFMPFAPSVLEEYMDEYFENAFYSPFMTFSFNVRVSKKDAIPAVFHNDGTARPHTVRKTVNPRYYDLIDEFRKLTGIPMVLNTSFNRHGLPLVHTPKEAIDHLLWGCVDILVMDDFVITRKAGIEEVDEHAQRALQDAYVDDAALAAAFRR